MSSRADLADPVFRLLADLVRQRTGTVVTEAHRPRMESRLAADAAAAGSFYRLYALLREEPPDSPSFGRLLDAAVNGETYFFRDEEGLAAFSDEIVPERLLAAGPDGSVDVWSAGCSTGEEPYSLAMVLAERGLLSPKVRILGTDASPGALRKARAAVYGPHALRATSPERLRTFFDPRSDGRFLVRPHVRGAVTFETRPFAFEDEGGLPCDVIVCRNVLMYLEPEARTAAVDLFAARLKPGGYLVLGPSDALAAASSPLALVRLSRDVAYRRPPAERG